MSKLLLLLILPLLHQLKIPKSQVVRQGETLLLVSLYPFSITSLMHSVSLYVSETRIPPPPSPPLGRLIQFHLSPCCLPVSIVNEDDEQQQEEDCDTDETTAKTLGFEINPPVALGGWILGEREGGEGVD